MKLSITLPSIHRVFKMTITNKMTFDDFTNELLIKCKNCELQCQKENLKIVIREDLVTKNNWEMLKNKYSDDNVHIISRLIIKPIECNHHK